MSRTSKSPLHVARTAYETGQKALPRYAHKFSRRDFTCPQLFAILVLRKFFKLDYRGVAQYLCEWEELRRILELHDKVPHYTTSQKAAAKLCNDTLIRKLITQTLDRVYNKAMVDCATHLILAARPGVGPRPDVNELHPFMQRMTSNVLFDQLLLHAGYDSEANHVMMREYLEVESIIPLTAGRPSDRLPTGKWRWLMATQFDEEAYGQRW